jgi:hypothetical protein
MCSKEYLYVNKYGIILHMRSLLSITKARLEPTTLSALEKAKEVDTECLDLAGARSSFTRCHAAAVSKYI